MGNKQTAVGYARVSTAGQVEHISLKDQQKQIQIYCKEKGLKLTKIYVEQASGKSDDRPEFCKMLGTAAQKAFDTLVVADNDRFGRSLEDRLRIRATLVRDFDIELHSVKDGIFKDNPTGRFTDTIKSSVSEYYRDLQVEKSASALQYKLEQGERDLGKLLYGLQWDKDKSIALHHETEYPLLRTVVDLRLKLKWSYTVIAQFLNGKINDAKAKKIANKHKIKLPVRYRSKLWDRCKVGYICSLNSKKYMEGKSSVEFQGKTYEYTFPPLITKEEYNNLKDILPDYLVSGKRKEYLLSDKLVCGLCHGKLFHNIIANTYKGKRKEYQYYSCRNKLEVPVSGKRCQLPSISQKWLDDEVWNQLEHLFEDQKSFEAVLFKSNLQLKEDRIKLGELYQAIDDNKKSEEICSTAIHNLVDAVAAGDMPSHYAKGKILYYEKLLKRYTEKRQELEFEFNLLTREITTIQKLEETRMWWWDYKHKLPEADKRKLIQAIVQKVTISPPRKQEEPNPDDSPAFVSVEIAGHIPLMDSKFYGNNKDGKWYSGILYKNLTFSI